MNIKMNDKKKIAVLTYHRHDNYGAVLQAYALQKVLRDMGTDACVLDYFCEQALCPLSLAAIRSRGTIACIKSLLGIIMRLPRKKAFRDFRSKLVMSRMYTRKTISEAADLYDSFIVGSDNVWNTDITGFDKTYFLNFVSDKEKKNSYAASMGYDRAPTALETEYKQLLKSFNHLYVREQSAAQFLSDLLDRGVEPVLDPTMLLSKEQWEDLSAATVFGGQYILAYQMVPSRKFVVFAQKQAKKYGCDLIFLPFAQGKFPLHCRHMYSSGPSQWLGLIKNAEYVITDSFHGCVFSILFGKKFAVYISQLGCRIDNLLSLFDLGERIVVPDQEFDMQKPVDYDKVNLILDRQRIRSRQAIRKIIGME